MKLYIDVDGVLNPFPNMGKMGDFDDFDNYDIPFPEDDKLWPGRIMTVRLSPKMAQELKNLGAEIVFNTTWCDHPEQLQELASHIGLEGTRQLHYDEVAGVPWRHYQVQKCLKLVEDAKKHEEPIIWIDDEAIDFNSGNFVKRELDAPKLFIYPHPRTGLTMYDISKIQEFIREEGDTMHPI